MATHSSVLAWRIPGMGSHRVGHDWNDLAAAAPIFALSLRRVWEGPEETVGFIQASLLHESNIFLFFFTIVCRNRSKREVFWLIFKLPQDNKTLCFSTLKRVYLASYLVWCKAKVVAIRHLRTAIERFVELCSILLKNSRVITSHTILRDSIWKERCKRRKWWLKYWIQLLFFITPAT